MRNIARLLTMLLLSVLWAGCTSVHPNQSKTQSNSVSISSKELASQIDSILNDSILSPSLVGIKIISLDHGNIIYQKNSSKLFHPGSNMKLITTAAALHLLDKGFEFSTEVFIDQNIQNGTINGNLYIKGNGDPLFKVEDIDSIVQRIRQRGIHTIKGDLVGDISYFDSLQWGAGWMWDDEPDPDEAFITPLTINSNAIELTITPSRKPGEPVNVTLNPNTEFVTIQNDGITSNDTLIPKLSVDRVRGENHIIVKGRISGNDDEKKIAFSVRHPELYFLTLVKEHLQKAGIAIMGTSRIGSVASILRIATVYHPIDSVIFRANKESDNIAAENILKSIAAEDLGTPGSAHNGLFLVRKYLASVGIDTTKMILADGSGVSWYNALSPDAMVELLYQEYLDQTAFKRFYESLPVAGIDGTLKNQMKGTSAEGKIHAKTGTLTGTSALSGYVRTADNHLLAFSIFTNHFPGKVAVLREIQNKLMELLAQLRLENSK